MKRLLYILAAACVTALAGCNTNGCLENRNSVPLAGFYDSSTGEAIVIDSLQVTGEGMPDDDPLSAAGKRINQLYLPMRSTRSTTSWIFSYKWSALDNPVNNDTITFDYESTPFFASDECGVIYKYDIKRMTYTTHLMDSVVLVDSLITNVDIERIKIYFHTVNE